MADLDLQSCCDKLSLRTGVKLVAVINLLWSLVLITFESVLLYCSGMDGVAVLNPEFIEPEELRNAGSPPWILSVSGPQSVPWKGTALAIIWLASWVLDVFFSILLYYGARLKSVKICFVWFSVRCAALTFRILFLCFYVLSGYSIITKVPAISRFLFTLYSLWIVNKFINQLRASRVSDSSSDLKA